MKTTIKDIQVVEECSCGHVMVDHEQIQIRVKDFSKVGIRKKKDRRTGEKFLVLYRKIECKNCETN